MLANALVQQRTWLEVFELLQPKVRQRIVLCFSDLYVRPDVLVELPVSVANSVTEHVRLKLLRAAQQPTGFIFERIQLLVFVVPAHCNVFVVDGKADCRTKLVEGLALIFQLHKAGQVEGTNRKRNRTSVEGVSVFIESGNL